MIDDLNDLNTSGNRNRIMEVVNECIYKASKNNRLPATSVFDVLNEIKKCDDLTDNERLFAAYQLGYGDHVQYIRMCLNAGTVEKDSIILGLMKND